MLKGISHRKRIPRLLTAKEVEELIRIDVKTLYSYVRRGLIPYVRIESSVRFSEEEIIEWLEERAFHPRRLQGPQKSQF
jgi:excisionase family DNA binding protein